MHIIDVVSDVIAVVGFFVASFILACIVIIWLRTKTVSWQQPKISKRAKGVVESGPQYTSERAVRERYVERLTHYAVPRAAYFGGLATLWYAYVIVGIIPPDVAFILLIAFLLVFTIYSLDGDRKRYW
jgi:hypothetical protein